MNFQSLAPGYVVLFASCEITPERMDEVDHFISRMFIGQAKYELVSAKTGVPWFVIGLIHGLECDFSFHQHLHNGDPLTARTFHEPVGRPKFGAPPFEWTDSAQDALNFDNLDVWHEWDVPGICFKLEAFNGYGYHDGRINIPSPYLWAGSNHYAKGKFVKDHVFEPEAVSEQIGAAVVLKRLCTTLRVALKWQPV